MDPKIGAMTLRLAPACRTALLCLTLLGQPAAVAAQEGFAGVQVTSALDDPFPYSAKGVGIDAMLQDVTAKTGVPVIAAEKFGGSVTLDNPDGSLRDAMTALARQGRVIWWFDGAALHVEPAGNMVSRLIPLAGFDAEALRRQMRVVGLTDPQYPLQSAGDAEMARLVAPKGYADAVAELAAHMAAARKPEATARRQLPTVIRGPRTH